MEMHLFRAIYLKKLLAGLRRHAQHTHHWCTALHGSHGEQLLNLCMACIVFGCRCKGLSSPVGMLLTSWLSWSHICNKLDTPKMKMLQNEDNMQMAARVFNNLVHILASFSFTCCRKEKKMQTVIYWIE